MTSPSTEPIYFSYSTAANLILRSPAYAYHMHKRLGGGSLDEAPSLSQISGTAIHSLILGAGAGSEVVVIPFDDFRKKEAQTQRDAALAEGKTPLTLRQFERLSVAADAIKANIRALDIRLDGHSEFPIHWTEQTQFGSVPCRAKLDHLLGPTIFDLKSIGCASPDSCAKQIINLGYDMQSAAYRSAFRQAHPELSGREKFVFIFFELDPPYSVQPITLSGQFRQIGEQRWRRALETWARCLATNNWPHYAEGAVEVHPPAWAVYREDAIYNAEDI